MADICKREADAFLFAVGELGFWESVPLVLHLARCKVCRREAARLRATSRQVAGAIGGHVHAMTLKGWALRGAWVAMVAAVSFGLYVAGQRAVEAALSTLNRPQIRQATYAEDPATIRRNRANSSSQ